MDAPHSRPKGLTFQPDIYQKVLALLPAMPGGRLLDVGAGEGYFAQLAAERGYEVEACDYRAESFKAPGIKFHRADLNESLPLPDESFDVVVSIEVLEHLENHVRFIRELLRVTRRGGVLLLTTPNVLSIPSRVHFCLYGYTDAARTPLDPALQDYHMLHINPISLPELLFLLERFGGELVELHTNRLRKSAWLPMILLYPLLVVALRAKLLRKKYADRVSLHRRHLRWMLHPANLMGRITIAVARRVR